MNMEVKRFEKEFHDKQGCHYETRWVEGPRFQCHYERIARHVKTYFKGKKSTILVDIGCGTGRGSLFLAETSVNIIGLDISLSILKIFKEKSSLKGLKNVDLILCDAENPPLRTEIADIVTFFGALHHLPNKIKALHEASRLLRLGGKISCHEPNREASKIPYQLLPLIASPIIRLRNFLKVNKVSKIINSDLSPYEVTLSVEEVKSMLLSLNFKILEAKTVWFFGILPLPPTLSRKISKVYYTVANRVDEMFERIGLYRNIAGAVSIIARKSGVNVDHG